MIRETGFFRYLQMRDIPFYPILQGKKREALPKSMINKSDLFTQHFKKVSHFLVLA